MCSANLEDFYYRIVYDSIPPHTYLQVFSIMCRNLYTIFWTYALHVFMKRLESIKIIMCINNCINSCAES